MRFNTRQQPQMGEAKQYRGQRGDGARFGVRRLAAALAEGACSRRDRSRSRIRENGCHATAASCLTQSGGKPPHSKIGACRRVPGAALALLVIGVFILATMIARAAPDAATPNAKLEPFTQTIPGTVVKLRMLPIPGESVKIGEQTISVSPFWMAQTETPWEAFDAFTSSGPASPPYGQTKFAPDAIARPSKSYILPDLGWGHNGYPVINVSFTSAQMFCRWLSDATHKKYRLPTEAEWVLACRGGTTGAWKIDKPTLDKSAWYAANSGGTSHPVGKKLPNKFGLYDMLGNVGEWATDPEGKPVLCGGTFLDSAAAISPNTQRRQTPAWQETDPQFPKSRWWLADGKFVGFRIVCEP